MPNNMRNLERDSELAKATMNKNTKKDNVLQNALTNYEYHQKRKKKRKPLPSEDIDNFSI